MSKFFDDNTEKVINENSLKNKEYSSFNKYILSRIKKDIEELWSKYEKYAPKSFKKKALISKENFYQRWWEMYLGCKVLDFGYDILKDNKRDEGPDLRIIDENDTYWIENVAPEMGKNINRLPEMELGVNRLPREEFLLRLNNSIENKINKYNDYIKKGIVKNKGKKIIAISTCNLSQYGSLMDYPELAIETVLFNKGNLIINLFTGEQKLKDKNGIVVKSDSGFTNIPTNIFMKQTDIDGVIYTHDEPLNINNKLYLIENPNSKLSEKFKKNFIIINY